MKRWIVALTALAALGGAGYAGSSHGPGTEKAHDGVWGGGRFETGFAGHRDLSVSAEGRGGHRGGDGLVLYGRNGIAQSSRVEIRCVNAEGNRAAIAGIIRESATPAFVGATAVWWVIDNGGPGSPTRDQSSFSFISVTEEDRAVFPDGYPNVCPSATEAPFDDPPLQFFDLVYGDIVVHDADE